MRSNDEKDISLTIGQSLRDSNGAIGVVEKIVNEFVFVRFPDGRHRIRRFSIGKEIFLIPEPESQPQRAIPIAPVISQKSQFSSIPQQLEGQRITETSIRIYDDGFNEDGFDKSGYDRYGFDREGFDREGYNKFGFDYQGYDRKGFNKAGYNRAGYDRKGYNKEGFNKFGYDQSGYNIEGFDQEGYDREGFNQDGYDREGYSRDGYDVHGLDREGNSRIPLIPFQTVLYHNSYGKGVFINLEQNRTKICVKFDSEIYFHWFTYPDSMEQYLFFQEMQISEKGNKDDEYLYEEKHFNDVKTIATKRLTRAVSRREDIESNRRYLSPEERMGLPVTITTSDMEEERSWRSAVLQPFFARLDYQHQKLYFGKIEIPGEVIDWADPRCSVYYNYQIYIGNKEYDLALVRDFEIRDGSFLGYKDVYVAGKMTGATSDGEIITDERLLAIIETYKEHKEVHDIIESIQSNQYQIITQNKNEPMLVNGCAGSGKTMIMYHRLRYLLYNNRDMKIDHTYLISPTDVLSQASESLSETLQISQANRFSIPVFYQYIIKCYADRIGTSFFQMKLTANNIVASKTLQKLYSKEECLTFIQKNYETFIKTDSKLRTNLIASETQKLKEILKNLGCKDFGDTLESLTSINNIFERALTIYQLAIKKQLTHFSIVNAQEMKKYANKQMGNEFHKRTADMLDYLIKHKSFTGETKYAKSHKEAYYAYDQEKASLTELRQLFGAAGTGEDFPFWDSENQKLKEDYSCGGIYKDPLELMAVYQNLHNRIERLQRFAEGENAIYLFDAIPIIITGVKKQHGLPTDSYYEWELFYTCLAAHTVCGALDYDSNYIFIDEFQDCAPTELECLSRIFPNAVFNLYGDLRQCINPKGIHSIQEIPLNLQQFSLRENYRNALEITQYANEKFGMDMLPIGIRGQIRTTANMPIVAVTPGSKDRVAIIYKDTDTLRSEGITLKNTQYHFLNETDIEIVTDQINVLPISLAKGLEFERVYVITDGMDENEKYVAVTRALNELVLVSSAL